MKWLSFFVNPAFKAVGFALVGVASAIKVVASPNTIAYHVADQVIGFGAMLGIASNGVQKKE